MEENQLHPELAFQAGIPQESKKYDVHPSLQAELEPEPEKPEFIPAEQQLSQSEEPEQPEEVEQPVVQETAKDRDWRAVRAQAERAKQLEREAEALARERDFYREQASKAQPKVEREEEDYMTDSERRLAREMADLKAQIAQQQKETQKAQQQAALSRAEQRLAQDYPDIKEVVSDENVEQLKLLYPHLYNSAVASSDIYTVGSAAYEFIMAKGIHKKPTSVINKLTANQAAARNQAKPKSVSTISPQSGDTPVSRASNFMGNSISSEDERKALYAEMVNASRNKI